MQFWNLKLKLLSSVVRIQECNIVWLLKSSFLSCNDAEASIWNPLVHHRLSLFTCWHIWNHRNKALFEPQTYSQPPYQVANMIPAKPTKVILHRTYMITNIRRNKRFLWAGNRPLEACTAKLLTLMVHSTVILREPPWVESFVIIMGNGLQVFT